MLRVPRSRFAPTRSCDPDQHKPCPNSKNLKPGKLYCAAYKKLLTHQGPLEVKCRVTLVTLDPAHEGLEDTPQKTLQPVRLRPTTVELPPHLTKDGKI